MSILNRLFKFHISEYLCSSSTTLHLILIGTYLYTQSIKILQIHTFSIHILRVEQRAPATTSRKRTPCVGAPGKLFLPMDYQQSRGVGVPCNSKIWPMAGSFISCTDVAYITCSSIFQQLSRYPRVFQIYRVVPIPPQYQTCYCYVPTVCLLLLYE